MACLLPGSARARLSCWKRRIWQSNGAPMRSLALHFTAPEVLDIKRRALRMIGEVARAKAVVSSTTSTIMVDEVAVYIT